MDTVEAITEARWLWKADRRAAAINLLQRAVRRDVTDQEANFLLAIMLMEESRPREAVRVLESFTPGTREEARRLSLLSQAQEASGNPDMACESLRASLAIEADAHREVVLAGYLRALGRDAEAVPLLEGALGRTDNEEGIVLLAELLETGDKPRALSLYRRATREYPNAAAGWAGLGKMLIVSGEERGVERAVDALRRAIELGDSSAWTFAYLGNALWRLQDLERAESAFRTALNDTENIGPAALALSRFLAAQDRQEDAHQLWHDVLEMHADSPGVRDCHRRSLANRGD